MTQQLDMPLPVTDIDLRRYVKFEPSTAPSWWCVGGERGRRVGEHGLLVGTIQLKHAGGYEVLLQFPDGKLDSFAPNGLFPVLEGA